MAQIADDFAVNRQDRCPVVLVLDTSGSMATENRIGQLNEGLQALSTELKANDLASLRVQIAIVTFDDDARLVQDFVDASSFQPPTLKQRGKTAMGKGMDLALELVEKQKQIIRNQGLQYYRPWIWLMSDGGPTDPDWEQAAERARNAAAAKKCVIYGIGVGDEADLDVLGKFSGKIVPLRLQKGKFAEMFDWLSRSVSNVTTNSQPVSAPGNEAAVATTAAGEQIKFDPPNWGTMQ